MPTLYKAKLTESETPWLESWDRIYWKLLSKSVPILTLLGFYAERDLPIPDADPARDLTNDEKTELGRIATSLTIAAAASEAMPIGVLIATLKKVSDDPSLFFSGQLSGEVEWVITRNYRRSDEKAAANWRDVWGNQPPQFEGQIEVPTKDNIARAALSAVSRIQSARRRGRPTTPRIGFLPRVWPLSFAQVGCRSFVVCGRTHATERRSSMSPAPSATF